MAKTKIVVLQLKEIIYTVIFAALGILLILLLIFMFWPDKEKDATTTSGNLYVPGKYTSSIELNDTTINLEVLVDKDHINSVQLINIDDSMTTMYPLVKPSLEEISSQLSNDVPIDQLKLSKDSQYTETLLIGAIKDALDKAAISED